MAASLYEPETVARSLDHAGDAEIPGLKDEEGHWDTRPHADRILEVDIHVLQIWGNILDGPGTPPFQARMIYPVNKASMRVLEKISEAPRIDSLGLHYSAGWNETTARRKGYFEVGSRRRSSWENVILQGPHFTVANPYFKEPNPSMRSNQDWTELDLESLPENFIPRTSYQPLQDSQKTYDIEYGHWALSNSRDVRVRNFYRLAWRRMASTTGERTLHVSIVPPGTAHVNTIYSAGGDWSDESLLSHLGLLSSIVADYFIKVSGASDIRFPLLSNLPTFEHDSLLRKPLMKRAAHLIALTSVYAPLIESAQLGPWSWNFPERRAWHRRKLLVEVDVLAALEFGLTLEELQTIYRTQFPVLQGYERNDLYDANGRKLPNEMNKFYRKVGEEGMSLEDRTWVHPHSEVEYVFEFPFAGVDREEDMRTAYEKFSHMLKEHGEIIEDEV